MDSKDIFIMIAQTALVMGREITLEQRDYSHESKVLGSMNASKTTDTGLIFRAFPPQDGEYESDAEDTDEEEDEDNDDDAADK